MIPNHPVEVLLTLDQELDHPVSLVLYGRAALALGFEHAPPEFQTTLDVDAIITLSQLPVLMDDFAFWDALDRTNRKLQGKGLYLTHLFSEDQVFLRPDWQCHVVPISTPATKYLSLSRPHVLDLILTKMMRGNDELDMADIRFLLAQEDVTGEDLDTAIRVARIPDLPELRDAFERAIPEVRAMAAARDGK
ncbi:hypothetical protein [Haloferula sargassicola]|uniref:Uncharacterized protein n=1 Tax=Haloferula sargassicola TaxID=490096 RepID=A0ABP9UTJ6_9BACT